EAPRRATSIAWCAGPSPSGARRSPTASPPRFPGRACSKRWRRPVWTRGLAARPSTSTRSVASPPRSEIPRDRLRAPPPGDSMRITSCGITDVGLKRGHNEDNYLINEELHLYVVADGMGGHAGGEYASAIAVNTVEEVVTSMERQGMPEG